MRYNLIRLRKDKGLTQENVSKLIDVKRSTYNAYELGTVDPSLEKAIKIKKLFKYEKDDIFLNENVRTTDNDLILNNNE